MNKVHVKERRERMELNLADRKVAMIFQGFSANYKESFAMLNSVQLNEIKNLCNVVNEKLSYDLWTYIHDTDNYTDDNQVMDWLAIYVANYSIYKAYLVTGYLPTMSLGYSMGLITAVACNGAISFEDGIDIFNCISKYKRKHSKQKENMAVIIGRTEQEVAETIAKENLSDSVEVSIVNNEDCITISGMDEAVEQIVRINQDAGALKASKLNSSIAFHSRYAIDGIEELEEVLSEINFKDLEIPILSVYSQKLLYHGTELQEELIKNMYSKMEWMKTLNETSSRGIEVFADVSMDGSLTKLSRLVLDEHEFITLNKLNRNFQKIK